MNRNLSLGPAALEVLPAWARREQSVPSLVSRDSSDGAVTISTGGSNAASTGAANALSGATDAAVGRFLSISPTIAVPQGTRITVMVDRDLEIF